MAGATEEKFVAISVLLMLKNSGKCKVTYLVLDIRNHIVHHGTVESFEDKVKANGDACYCVS